MKIKNVKITVKETKAVLKEFADFYEKAKRGEHVEPHHEVSFENLDTLKRTLTDKRLELIHVIKKHDPDSIYQLAKMVNRDLKSVNTDLQILESSGLISLDSVKEGRHKVKPRVEFDKLNVEIAI